MKKYIKDGEVAVLISPGYGAGWSSWHHNEEALFDSTLVDMVLNGCSAETMDEYVAGIYGESLAGDVSQLTVKFVPIGSKFRIDEYDGAELLVLLDEEDYYTA